jgi:hypothetical protein
MERPGRSSTLLAAAITRAASKQTYYTIRLFVDRPRVQDAMRAYAYFRWVDDQLDLGAASREQRNQFLDRQMTLVQNGYQGRWEADLSPEETMLKDMITGDCEKDSGLRSYIQNMMAVMAFDTRRRGQVLSQDELAEYTGLLARAVTDALHHFIGHGCRVPSGEVRYLAVSAAHITHMLRDTIEDTQAGYYNISREFLEAHHLAPGDVNAASYRLWVRNRVQLAHSTFAAAKNHLRQIDNRRCRLAGWAYVARFECVLEAIEKDAYHLQAEYRQRKTFRGMIRMLWCTLQMALSHPQPEPSSPVLSTEKTQPA